MKKRDIVLIVAVVLLLIGIGVALVVVINRPHTSPPPTQVPRSIMTTTVTATSTPVVVAWIGPLIPLGKLPVGTKYSTIAQLKAHPLLVWGKVTYLLHPGRDGRLWGKTDSGKMVLLYGTFSAYC